MNRFALFACLLVCGAPDDVAEYRKELGDPSYANLWDRREAAKSLGRLGTRAAAEALLEFAACDDPATREAIVLALAALRDDPVRRFVLEVMPRLRDERARAGVVRAFGRMKWADARDGVHRMLRDPSPAVRIEAARTLAAMGDPRCVEAAADARPEVVEQALLCAAACGAPVDARLFDRLVRFGSGPIQGAALRWKAAVEPETLDLGPFARGRFEARLAVADLSESVEPFRQLINDPDWRVRAAAVAGLERLWSAGAVCLLIDRLGREDGRLVLDIVSALERMTGRALGYDPKAWAEWWRTAAARFEMPPKPQGPRSAAPPAGQTRASFYGVPILSKRIVFVLDASGSMKTEDERSHGDRKIDVALRELGRAVAGLADDAKFNVIMLSTEAKRLNVRSLSPRLVLATPSNRARALELVRRAWHALEGARRGRGDHYEAVMEAMADPETDTVVLLSDGKPTDGSHLDRQNLIEAMAAAHRGRRICIHAVMTGTKGVDEEAMAGIAEVTRGLYVPVR
jgi:HEAT repeat protein